MPRRLAESGFAALVLVLPLAAHAGRPLTTEDASVIGEGRCQLEAWIDRASEATQGWLAPACDFGAGIEWQFGFARLREAGASRFSDAYFQAKWRVPGDEHAAWQLAFVGGVARHPLAGERRGWNHPYALAALGTRAGETLVHGNIGVSRDAQARRDLIPWGVAVEHAAARQAAFVAEAFGENAARPFVRAGFRWEAVKDMLDLDLSYVIRLGGERSERFLSLGLHWQSPGPR